MFNTAAESTSRFPCPKIISGNENWIDNNHDIRNDIAHGNTPINVEQIETVLNEINTIQQVAYQFIVDWRNANLAPQIPPCMQELYSYNEYLCPIFS